mmetsp:Transcript_5043/g.10285  ORF Transcript_5043/g.10285 Transcript_5043/m.10285 type:complete len:219 (-) Transcript_5043:37-693(-)
MDQLCGRLDVTGLYAALFVSAELALLMTNETPVSSDASQLVFAAGFAISLAAFTANILLVKAMHAAKANLMRDADIIVWVRHGADAYIFGSFYTVYIGFGGMICMASPVLLEGYGLGPTLIVLVTMTLVFVILEFFLVGGSAFGLSFTNNLAATRSIHQWRANKMANDNFLGTACYLVPIVEARIQRARKLRLRSHSLKEQHRKFLSEEVRTGGVELV